MKEEFIIYPTAKICREFKHGKTGDISDFVFCNSNLYIGERSHLATGVRIVGSGSVHIGNDVQIGPNVVIYTSVPNVKGKSISKYKSETEILIKNVHIGNNVFIGAGAIIPLGSVVPDNTIVRALTYYKTKKVEGKAK